MKLRDFVLGFVITIATMAADGRQFQGYSRKPNSETMTLVESVVRFEETKTSFMILLSNHAAFYFFPKDQDEDKFRDYLNQKIKLKQAVSATIDLTTAKILEIHDATGTQTSTQ